MAWRGLGGRYGSAVTGLAKGSGRLEQRWLGWFWLLLLLALAALVTALVYVGWPWTAGVVAALGSAALGFAFWQRHGWLVSAIAPAVVVLVIGALVLFATGQGRDLGLAMVDAGTLQLFCFAAALLYWAAAVWHNARVRVDVAFANRQEPLPIAALDDACDGPSVTAANGEPWRKWTPRGLGAVVFVMAATHLVLVGWPSGFAGLLPSLVIVGLGFMAYWLIVVYRRKQLAPWLGRLVGRVSGRLERWAFDAATPQPRALIRRSPIDRGRLDDELVAPTSSIVTSLVFVVLGLIVAVPAWIVPVELGWLLGSMAIGFFAFGSYLVLLTLLWIVANRRGFGVSRVLVPLLLLAVAGTFTRPYHEVRLVKGSFERPSLAATLDEWRTFDGLITGNADATPMIVVATAGGGLRAAYWTATVLAELERRLTLHTGDPRAFRRHLFAISGVSGGSVGAAFFARAPGPDAARPLDQSPVLSALEHDFLAPTLASLAFVDLPSLILPNWGQPSRGIVLERAFEAGLRADTGQHLDVPFLQLREAEGWQPLLLLNGTHQKSGRRLIASHVELPSDVFLDSFDLHHLLESDLPLSTAAHNSARFTFVSPAGTLQTSGGDPRGHIIDGGYFENFGAVTMLQLVRAVLEMRDAAPDERRIRPIVIQISSDPGLGTRDRSTATDCVIGDAAPLPFEPNDAGGFWANSQLLAPLRGVLATRGAQGRLASKELARLGCRLDDAEPAPVFAHFAMCDDLEPPLGWVMSAGLGQAIRDLVGACDNARLFDRVVEAFGSAARQTD